MSEARIEFAIGSVSFVGEGDKEWVSEQLDKILSQAEGLIGLTPKMTEPFAASVDYNPPNPEPAHHQAMQPDSDMANKTLPTLLNEKGASKSQNKKFLATAIWLEAKGKSRISPGEVTRALKDANQSKLGNPSDCLAKNISKGYCERDGKEFFVTQEGKDSI